MGSSALHLAYLAAGKFDAFFAENLEPWEKAAGMLIVKEAGGFITDAEGSRDVLNSKTTIAANPSLHSELVTLIREKD